MLPGKMIMSIPVFLKEIKDILVLLSFKLY